MFNSNKYWDNRYKHGGNSGAGSYGKLANFKAKIINTFVSENNIDTMIDYGVGDGNQLRMFNIKNYIGIDVSPYIINKCKRIFKNDQSKKFYIDSEYDMNGSTDLVISCDVLYHLINEDIYEKYMKNMFTIIPCKYVIIYAANVDKTGAIHVKKRKFTEYIENNFPTWELIKKIDNPYKGKSSESDFFIYKKK